VKRNLRVLVFLSALFTLGLTAGETVDQCLTNCPPGNNGCSQCCLSQSDAITSACSANCQAAQSPCVTAAISSCGPLEIDGVPVQPDYPCITKAMAPCNQAIADCQNGCQDVAQIAGGCPGEVLPQTCPFNCQSWNPASQSCIGPDMNECAGMMAVRAPLQTTESVAVSSPTPSNPCYFDCQKWDDATKSCIGDAKNGCEARKARALQSAAAAQEHTKQLMAKPKAATPQTKQKE
jgi:hypothetical protein